MIKKKKTKFINQGVTENRRFSKRLSADFFEDQN
jgi:hypothetical protein